MNRLKRQRNLLQSRPLLGASVVFCVILGVLCYTFGKSYSAIVCYILALGISALCFPVFGRRAAITVLCVAAAAILYFNLYLSLFYTPAIKLDDFTGEILVELIDFPVDKGEYCILECKILSPSTEIGPDARATVFYSGNADKLRPGDRLRVYGKVSAVTGTGFSFGAPERRFLTLSVYRVIEVTPAGHMPIKYSPAYFSSWLCNLIFKYLRGDDGAVLTALLTGKTEYLSAELKSFLAVSGTYHIVSVSGMHVGLLAGLIVFLLGKKRGTLAAIPIVVFFGLSTGFKPPVFRAILMMAVAALAFFTDRENDPPTTLMAALAAILIHNPFAVTSASLQLSFGSVAGILFLSPPLKELMCALAGKKLTKNKAVSAAIAGLSVSVGATLAVYPLGLLYFERASIIGPGTILTVLWAIGLLLPLGAALAIIGAVSPPLASFVALYVLRPLLMYFRSAVIFFGGLPFASVSSGSIAAGALCALILGCLLYDIVFAVANKRRTALVLAAVSLTTCLYGLGLDSMYAKEMVFTEKDITALAIYDKGQLVIISSGCDTSGSVEKIIEEAANAFGITAVKAIIFTSPNPAIGKLISAVPFRTDAIYMSPGSNRSYHDEKNQLLWYYSDTVIMCGRVKIKMYPVAEGYYGAVASTSATETVFACGASRGTFLDKVPREDKTQYLILDGSLLQGGYQLRSVLQSVKPDLFISSSPVVPESCCIRHYYSGSIISISQGSIPLFMRVK